MSHLFPIATTTSLGLVQAGTNISIDAAGVISTTSSGGATTGTWTPSLVSSSSSATITLTVDNANYVKVGQLVTCTFDFTIQNESGGSSSGVLTLNGLPFTSITESKGGYVGSVYVSFFCNMNTDVDWLTGSVVANSKTADMFHGAIQAKVLPDFTQNDIKSGSRLVGTITYLSTSSPT